MFAWNELCWTLQHHEQETSTILLRRRYSNFHIVTATCHCHHHYPVSEWRVHGSHRVKLIKYKILHVNNERHVEEIWKLVRQRLRSLLQLDVRFQLLIKMFSPLLRWNVYLLWDADFAFFSSSALNSCRRLVSSSHTLHVLCIIIVVV